MLGAPELSGPIVSYREPCFFRFAARRSADGTLVGVPRASVSNKPRSTSCAACRMSLRLAAAGWRGSGIAAWSRSWGSSRRLPVFAADTVGPADRVSRRRLAGGRFGIADFFDVGTAVYSFAGCNAIDAPTHLHGQGEALQ